MGGAGDAAAGGAPGGPAARHRARLAGDVTSGRRDDLRAAAASIGAAEGTGVEDMVIGNDRPAGVTARVVMTFPGWLQDPWSGLADFGHAARGPASAARAGRLLPGLEGSAQLTRRTAAPARMARGISATWSTTSSR